MYRDESGIVLLNRYPYSYWHLLVALGYPRPTLLDYEPAQRAAFWKLIEVGAELIEKHFTLDKTLEGTDHILSADPAELAAITDGCRRVDAMLGDAVKRPGEGELANRDTMRGLFREPGA